MDDFEVEAHGMAFNGLTRVQYGPVDSRVFGNIFSFSQGYPVVPGEDTPKMVNRNLWVGSLNKCKQVLYMHK